MDAIGKQMHMRGNVYDVRHPTGPAHLLPLIERVRERSFEARVDAIFIGAAAAWVAEHRAELRSGTTLLDLALHDIRPHGDLLRAVVMTPPTIAPPRHTPPPVSSPTSQAAAA